MDMETASKTKNDPIIIEQAGMRMTVAHRHGLGGSDEGLTFDIMTATGKDEEKEFYASTASTKITIIASAPPAAKARLTR